MLRKILGTQSITGFVGGKKGRTVKQQVMPETTIQLLNSFRSTDMLNLLYNFSRYPSIKSLILCCRDEL